MVANTTVNTVLRDRINHRNGVNEYVFHSEY